ncbi:GNAT family N-acetyltransferase [Pseudonocardia nigra]|uniref:GNAT family N-acetyltransferase n=1 Tax=Pseudonocardia nigra TaxID=1921578 RepID=UPI001C5EA739|nr:GNAT family N-acetyltransferase [Pseudonocardia nigra]
MLTAADEIAAGPVVLRRWRPGDADALYRAVSESLEHLAPWMPWAVNGYSTAEAAAYVARAAEVWGTDYDYGIVAPGEVIVGCCSLMGRIGDGGFEIGYWVHPRHTRRGYATAAAAALTAEAFRIGADRVEIVHDVANVPSGSVPRGLGFTEVDRRIPQDERTAGEAGLDVVWRLVPGAR